MSERERGNQFFCRACHYPLNGLGMSGSCPECGNPFDLEDASTISIKVRGTSPAASRLRRLTIGLHALILILSLVFAGVTFLIGMITGMMMHPSWSNAMIASLIVGALSLVVVLILSVQEWIAGR